MHDLIKTHLWAMIKVDGRLVHRTSYGAQYHAKVGDGGLLLPPVLDTFVIRFIGLTRSLSLFEILRGPLACPNAPSRSLSLQLYTGMTWSGADRRCCWLKGHLETANRNNSSRAQRTWLTRRRAAMTLGGPV